MSIKLYNQDCIDFLKTLDDNSIDCVITDPPYGTNNGKGKVIKRGVENVAFGVIEWDKELPLKYMSEIYRVIKNDTWGGYLYKQYRNNNGMEYVRKSRVKTKEYILLDKT